MSRYCDSLISYIESNPSFIEPEQHRNSILYRLRKEGLKDLSVSRTTFAWGVPVPQGFDSRHVMYVWFDALSNYLSGVNALDSTDPLSVFWPASVHVIGKDIIWFHCVIWPCMLMSAGLPLPSESSFSSVFGLYMNSMTNMLRCREGIRPRVCERGGRAQDVKVLQQLHRPERGDLSLAALTD